MNVTIETMLSAIAGLIQPVGGDDSGKVLTRERFTASEEKFADLFTSLESERKPKGWLIQWVAFAQRKGSLVCTVRQRHRFALEFLYPYNDKKISGKTSFDRFLERVQAVNDALNETHLGEPSWNLGISEAEFPGSHVEHQFLQSESEAIIKQWGEGQDAIRTHYARFVFEVEVTVGTHTEEES